MALTMHRVQVTSPMPGIKETGFALWNVGSRKLSERGHTEWLGRGSLAIETGTCTLNLSPTPEECRALAAKLAWLADAIERDEE